MGFGIVALLPGTTRGLGGGQCCPAQRAFHRARHQLRAIPREEQFGRKRENLLFAEVKKRVESPMRLGGKGFVPCARIAADGRIQTQCVIDLIGVATRDCLADGDDIGVVGCTICIRHPPTDGGVLLDDARQGSGCAKQAEPEQGKRASRVRMERRIERRGCFVTNHSRSVETITRCLLHFPQRRANFGDCAGDDYAFRSSERAPVYAYAGSQRIGKIKNQAWGGSIHAGLIRKHTPHYPRVLSRTGVSVRFCGFLARRDDDADCTLLGGATLSGSRKSVQSRP